VTVAVPESTVLRMAALAGLALEPAEAAGLAADLTGILAHVEALAEVDVQGVPEVSMAVEAGTAARADVPGADALAVPPARFAPGWAEPFFTVPRLATLDPDAQEAG
jgi:aspartyl/glutamyl-tRNA(Asn/Gln) amidotransferase C subunit